MKKVLILSIACLSFVACKNEKADAVVTEDNDAPVIENVDSDAPATVATEDVDAGNVDETAAVGEVVKLEIHGTDAMKFDKNELRVPAGSKVELTLKHTGEMPESSMGHNWVLLKQGTDVQEFAMGAMDAKDTEYVPTDATNVIAHTEVIGGGETTTITFDAPEAGTYDFLCSFPGHFSNMKGKFIVE